MSIEDPITEPKMKSAPVTEPPMVQVAKATDIRNPWICRHCGAIMGSVVHERVRAGLSITRLILFRGAVFIHETLPVNFIFGKVDAGEFGCGRCGTIRPWIPTAETIRYLSEPHRPAKKNRNR